jgi:IPT/TIG domain
MGLVQRIVLPCLMAGTLGLATLGCSGHHTSPPSIVSSASSSLPFTPAQEPIGNTLIIYGSGFAGTTAVSIGGVAVEAFTVVNDGQIDALVPANAVTGPIVVTNSAGISASSTSFYVVPTIDSFTSSTDPTAGKTMHSGDTVTITGSGFVGATAPLVFYGPASSPGSTPQPAYTVVSANQITTTVPTGIPAGSGYVLTLTVPGPNGGSINNNPPDNILPNPSFTVL